MARSFARLLDPNHDRSDNEPGVNSALVARGKVNLHMKMYQLERVTEPWTISIRAAYRVTHFRCHLGIARGDYGRRR